MELDAIADLKGVSRAVLGLLDFRAQIADEVGRRGRVFRVDPDQRAVKGRRRMYGSVGAFAMTVKARRRVRWDHIGENPALLWRLLRQCRSSQDCQSH